jgi:hypothetical protein
VVHPSHPETDAENLTYDLSVGVGDIPPSFVDAGFTRIEPTDDSLQAMGLEPIHWTNGAWVVAMAAILGGLIGGLMVKERRHRDEPVNEVV